MTLEAPQQAPLTIHDSDLSALLRESEQLGASYIRKGYYTYEETRRSKEILGLITASGVHWNGGA
ncbi:hypothetical protein E4H04_13115 [Candidatus Bathyarchaeota archaeon]|nr:MAG: hypothetical protein E4H04_13115 [Candidatus Bathyarchaeota archaeon]